MLSLLVMIAVAWLIYRMLKPMVPLYIEPPPPPTVVIHIDRAVVVLRQHDAS